MTHDSRHGVGRTTTKHGAKKSRSRRGRGMTGKQSAGAWAGPRGTIDQAALAAPGAATGSGQSSMLNQAITTSAGTMHQKPNIT